MSRDIEKTKKRLIKKADAGDIDAMLDYCGTSIAMGNAPDFVKEHADYICDHIDKDGLAKALKHFKLI